MQFRKLVQIDDVEVTITLTAADITEVLTENGEQEGPIACFRVLNSIATCLRGVPDSLIVSLNEGQKRIVREFLEEQSKRYQ